jgi:hypothetical protein
MYTDALVWCTMLSCCDLFYEYEAADKNETAKVVTDSTSGGTDLNREE